jgi:choice-of-anchor A domain-containing protein
MKCLRPARFPSSLLPAAFPCSLAMAFALSLAAASLAGASLLGTAGNYGEFILGNSQRTNVDAQGRVAVGGNASFNNFTVASQQLTTTTNLVVGGTLTAQSASVRGHVVTGGNAGYTTPTVMGDFSSNGSLTLGGRGTVNGNIRYNTAYSPAGTTVSGTVTGSVSTPLPINFATQGAYLSALSAAQVHVGDPSPSFMFSQLFINGMAGENFFNLTGAQVAAATGGFNINAPVGATVVLYVSGTGFTIPNTGFNLSGGITVDHLLWNFHEATSFTIQGSARGTFLAPGAAITTSFGGFNGNLIAASLNGSIETHLFDGGGTGGQPTPFDGPLRPVPEASSLAMAGIAALVSARLGRVRSKTA